MEYYVQNPDEFKEKFQNADVPKKYSHVPPMETSSQYYKFDTYFNPGNFSKEDGKCVMYAHSMHNFQKALNLNSF